jgi:alkylation response protein AidB-like acyl-CoA dehydrogenase
MTLLTADETGELARSVRGACDRLATKQRVREIAYGGTGMDTELWQMLCQRVGVAAIALPESLGGAGYGTVALGVVAHELGRALAPVPFLSSAVLATGLLLDTDDPPEKTLIALATGERTAAAVLGLAGGAWQSRDPSIVATHANDRWTLDGTARHVLGAAAADDLVIVAAPQHRWGGSAVFLVDADNDGVTRTAERVLDGTRPMATVTLTRCRARRLTGPDSADALIARNVHRAMAVLSAEQVGSHERILEIAVDYARTREQFGRPIGSFQAVKHRCADMLVDLEWSRSASHAALQAADEDPSGSADELGWRVSMAKAVCSEALRDAAHGNLQIHGGIGFTWEDAAHLYLRRARTDEVIFGGPGVHWDLLRMGAELA